jgi:hypothetical protein
MVTSSECWRIRACARDAIRRSHAWPRAVARQRPRGCIGTASVKRRCRVVLDAQLDRLAPVLPCDAGCQRQAMSISADTPAAVTFLPSNTTWSPLGLALKEARSSCAGQCVVGRPFRRPAGASTRAAVHAESVQVDVPSTCSSHVNGAIANSHGASFRVPVDQSVRVILRSGKIASRPLQTAAVVRRGLRSRALAPMRRFDDGRFAFRAQIVVGPG